MNTHKTYRDWSNVVIAFFIVFIIAIVVYSLLPGGSEERSQVIGDVCVEDGVPQIIETRSTFNRIYIVYKRTDGAYVLQNAHMDRDYEILYWGECNGESANRAP